MRKAKIFFVKEEEINKSQSMDFFFTEKKHSQKCVRGDLSYCFMTDKQILENLQIINFCKVMNWNPLDLRKLFIQLALRNPDKYKRSLEYIYDYRFETKDELYEIMFNIDNTFIQYKDQKKLIEDIKEALEKKGE